MWVAVCFLALASVFQSLTWMRLTKRVSEMERREARSLPRQTNSGKF